MVRERANAYKSWFSDVMHLMKNKYKNTHYLMLLNHELTIFLASLFVSTTKSSTKQWKYDLHGKELYAAIEGSKSFGTFPCTVLGNMKLAR